MVKVIEVNNSGEIKLSDGRYIYSGNDQDIFNKACDSLKNNDHFIEKCEVCGESGKYIELFKRILCEDCFKAEY